MLLINFIWILKNFIRLWKNWSCCSLFVPRGSLLAPQYFFSRWTTVFDQVSSSSNYFFNGPKKSIAFIFFILNLDRPFSELPEPILIIFEVLKSSVSQFFENDFLRVHNATDHKIFSSIVITMRMDSKFSKCNKFQFTGSCSVVKTHPHHPKYCLMLLSSNTITIYPRGCNPIPSNLSQSSALSNSSRRLGQTFGKSKFWNQTWWFFVLKSGFSAFSDCLES